MNDEYYGLGHRDVATGLQTGGKLEELDLGDVARDLEQRGFLAGVGWTSGKKGHPGIWAYRRPCQ